jgi:hypothetical protein
MPEKLKIDLWGNPAWISGMLRLGEQAAVRRSWHSGWLRRLRCAHEVVSRAIEGEWLILSFAAPRGVIGRRDLTRKSSLLMRSARHSLRLSVL